jgi:hypothetical protein
MRGRRKKRVKAKDCVNVLRLFHSAGIEPEYIVDFLERITASDEVFLQMCRLSTIGTTDIQLQLDVTKMERDNCMAQMLASIIRIGLLEAKDLQYINPSLN